MDIPLTIVSDVPGMEPRPHSTAAELVARLWTNEERVLSHLALMVPISRGWIN